MASTFSYHHIRTTRVQVMGRRAGFWFKVGLCNPSSHGNPNSATFWLDGLGQTQEKKPKKTAPETQRSEVKEDGEMDRAREGSFYP